MALFGGSRRRRHRKSGMRKRGGEGPMLPELDLSKSMGLTGGSRRRRRRGRKSAKK